MFFTFFLLSACAKPEPLPTLGALPDFALTDEAGAPATRARFADHVTIVDFMFTSCPDICPTLSARMSELQKHFADEPKVQLVSISVDPAYDTPPILTAYGKRFDADPAHWHFFTGEATAVRGVVVDGFKTVMTPGDEPKTVLHGSRFVVVDGNAVIRGYPDPKVPNEVEATVQTLLATGW